MTVGAGLAPSRSSPLILEVAGFGPLNATDFASAEIYHAKTNSFSVVSNQLGIAVERVHLAALPDGTALEAGARTTTATGDASRDLRSRHQQPSSAGRCDVDGATVAP